MNSENADVSYLAYMEIQSVCAKTDAVKECGLDYPGANLVDLELSKHAPGFT